MEGETPCKVFEKELVNEPKRCGSCEKTQKCGRTQRECAVLKVMVGQVEECWAWSDDPLWGDKVKIAIKKHYGAYLKKGNKHK